MVVSALSVSLSFDGGDDRLTGDDAITIIILQCLSDVVTVVNNGHWGHFGSESQYLRSIVSEDKRDSEVGLLLTFQILSGDKRRRRKSFCFMYAAFKLVVFFGKL